MTNHDNFQIKVEEIDANDFGGFFSGSPRSMNFCFLNQKMIGWGFTWSSETRIFCGESSDRFFSVRPISDLENARGLFLLACPAGVRVAQGVVVS